MFFLNIYLGKNNFYTSICCSVLRIQFMYRKQMCVAIIFKIIFGQIAYFKSMQTIETLIRLSSKRSFRVSMQSSSYYVQKLESLPHFPCLLTFSTVFFSWTTCSLHVCFSFNTYKMINIPSYKNRVAKTTFNLKHTNNVNSANINICLV